MEENEKDENSFAFENKNNEEQQLFFPLYYNRNPSYAFPNIEDDELNPFKDLHSSKAKEYKFWDGDDNECIQFNFEYIVSKAQLIMPLFLSFYVKKPDETSVRRFTHFMIRSYP